jgi:hypothetical protein
MWERSSRDTGRRAYHYPEISPLGNAYENVEEANRASGFFVSLVDSQLDHHHYRIDVLVEQLLEP